MTASEPTLAEILADGETEERSVYTASNGGVSLTVTVDGFSNKDKGYDFYVKSNDYFIVHVKVENNSGKEIYKLNSSGIHSVLGAENVELQTYIADAKGNELTPRTAGMIYTDDLLLWSIPAGESYEWDLFLAAGYAGEYMPGKPADLTIEGYEADGIYLYDESIYSGGVCEFSGATAFWYSYTDNGNSTVTDQKVTADVTIPVLYVEPMLKDRGDRSLADYLAEDEKECNMSYSSFNNGIGMTVTLHGYSNRGKGYGFYVKSNDYIIIDVNVTNNKSTAIYQLAPYLGHGYDPSPNVELNIGFDDGNEHRLSFAHESLLLECLTDLWSMDAGDEYSWRLRAAAAYFEESDYDLEPDSNDRGEGLKLYDESIYSDGMCEFSGTITFAYSDTNNGNSTVNDLSISKNVTIPVLYVK